MGAVLSAIDHKSQDLVPLAAIEGKVTKNVAGTLGIKYNDPSGQAIRYWVFKLRDQKILLKADSTVALAVSKKLSSSTPTLNWVGAELGLVLEAFNMEELTIHHLAGKLNVAADHLSRPDKEGAPPGLGEIQIRVMNEAWMLDSRLPPPGVHSDLWGKAPGLLPVFDNL